MQADRNARALTGGVQMQRQLPPSPERDSIYGDTYLGVPNPRVPFRHAYPTRYHGPVFTFPVAGQTYVPAPYTEAPFLGVDFLGWRSISPTGFGGVADILLGALVGYLTAPDKKQAMIYAAAGGIATGALGSIGLIGIVGVSAYQHFAAKGTAAG